MARRFKPRILAKEATAPYNGYDSEIELPSRRGNLLKKNAWLTLRMRMLINFVDGTNPNYYRKDHSSGMVKKTSSPHFKLKQIGSTFYAPDHDGWLFPILNWPADQKAAFRRDLIRHALQVWNHQFVLKTPSRYGGLDMDFNFDTRYRPNLICLFRLESVALSANPHLAINIVRLDPTTTKVKNLDGNTKDVPAIKDGGTFRSDASNYDDRDLRNPAMSYMGPILGSEKADTIGHEIGHALGQGHILEIMGKPCLAPFPGTTEPNCSGGTDYEKANIQGFGSRVYLVNAISWQKRASLHCPGTSPQQWVATGRMNTPGRKVA